MTDESGEVMTDADFEKALDALREQEQNGEVGELLKMMNENRMISWEEAEQILGGTSYNEPVKSSLPEQTRPTEPDNDTDVDVSIQRLLANDPKLKEVNLNNMKRTPIPQVKRLIAAIRDNTYLEKLALANMGLYDSNVEPLFDVVENNETLKSINLETNYLSGDFFAKLFQAALKNQTLEEVKAVNQGVTFSTTSEKEIIDAIFANRGIIKVSINLRLPEGRHKIENAMLRNGEIKRVLRRQAAQAAKAAEEANKKTEEEQKKTKKTDEVKKDSAKKAVDATKTAKTAAAGAKKPVTKTSKTDTAPAKTEAVASTKTPTAAKTTAKSATEKTDDSATKAVKTKTAPKAPAKSTADSSTKAPSTKTATDSGTKKSTTSTKSSDTTAAPPKTTPKTAAVTEKKTSATTSSTKEAESTDAKPKTKPAPAVPPKKKTVAKSATEKAAATESKADGEASATKSKTPSKPKKTATSDDKLSEPMAVYPLKKAQKQ